MSQKSRKTPPPAKKISVVWRPFEPIKKEYKKRAGPGASLKNLKVPPFVFRHRHHNNIYLYSPGFIYSTYEKEDDDEDQGFVWDERAWGRRSLAPNRPGSSFAGLSREHHARKREKERASFHIEKKKRGKEEGSDETTRGGAHPRIARAS